MLPNYLANNSKIDSILYNTLNDYYLFWVDLRVSKQNFESSINRTVIFAYQTRTKNKTTVNRSNHKNKLQQ